MSSATGIPEPVPDVEPERDGRETEPLLGRPGDVSQRESAPIAKNLILGTGIIAEAGAVLLAASVWAAIFMHLPLTLFSVHPLAQSLGLLVLVQSILVLQPTHSGRQKEVGRAVHASLNLTAFGLFVAGIGSIEYNKGLVASHHFKSAHAYLGIASAVWLALQYLVGFTMYALPALYGGEARARAVWKYHRASGYALLLLMSATTISAADTDYNVSVLGLRKWVLALVMALIIVGIFPRIKKHKLGL